MSVVGSLEDLSFPDVLQIVRASRRSGTLILNMRDGERRVRFTNGLVRGGTLSSGGPELEDLLRARGLVDAETLHEARLRAARDGIAVTGALVECGGVSQDVIERLVRDELKSSLRSLVLSQEGEFRFEVEDERPAVGQVLLVVESSVLRRALELALRRAGFGVTTCATAERALERARILAQEGGVFHLVCDRILPDDSGEGWRGGVELISRIRRLSPGARGLLLGEALTASAAFAGRAAGISAFVPVPDLAGADWDDVGRVLEECAGRVRDAVLDPRGPASPPAARPLRVVDQLSLLRGLVGELHAEQEIEIPLLVLRLATEYLERGVLFNVQDGQACGTGAFGGGREGAGDLDARVRGAAVPLLRGSILETAVRTRSPYVGPIEPSLANAPLIEKLGAPLPQEAAVFPVIGGPEVLALLYGDNGGSARPVGDLRGLEIFVAQAGIALQSAALQRRLSAIPGRDRSASDV